MADMISGEDRAWEIIEGCDPADVCRRTGALFDAVSCSYRIDSFGHGFSVDARDKKITHLAPEGEIFLRRLRYFFVLSVLWYMVKATDVRLTGRLQKPSGMAGGEIFFRGSHVLPLEALAKQYRTDREGFLRKAAEFGGREVPYGDAAAEFLAFPRIPVTVILWLADDEWDARADILFDASALAHLPLDIVWSVAMMALLIFL